MEITKEYVLDKLNNQTHYFTEDQKEAHKALKLGFLVTCYDMRNGISIFIISKNKNQKLN